MAWLPLSLSPANLWRERFTFDDVDLSESSLRFNVMATDVAPVSIVEALTGGAAEFQANVQKRR